jgi:undecaprenyl-diphosphatase
MAAVRRLDEAQRTRAMSGASPGRDRALVALTSAADHSRLWLTAAAVLAALGGRPGRHAAGSGIVAIALASAVANGPAKLLVARRRPSGASMPALIRMPRSSSFPSGHSASAFAFATAVCAELPWLTPVVVPLAGAVAYSRVQTGVHYPTDVAAGGAIGIACGVIARRLVARAGQCRTA